MIYCLFGLVNLFACGEKSATKPANVIVPVITRPVFASKTFIDKTEGEDIPRTVVSIIWQEQVMTLDTMIGEFHPVDTGQYVRHRIPKTAIASGTGFWAGLETTYLIDSTAMRQNEYRIVSFFFYFHYSLMILELLVLLKLLIYQILYLIFLIF